MSAFKILVTSQKGGVGKSTISANLAAYMCRAGQTVTMIDFDTHGSSSTWLNRAPDIGVIVQHRLLPLDKGSNRPILEARLHLCRAANTSDVVICDLTWSDSISADLMFEYDLVIVPTSVSEIELAATAGFLSRLHWVFDSTTHTPPSLLICPTRVQPDQLSSDVFSKTRFPVSFMLTPPVLESESARESFEHDHLMNLDDSCGASFNEFAKAVCDAREMHESARKLMQNPQAGRWNSSIIRSSSLANPVSAHLQRSNYPTGNSMTNHHNAMSQPATQQAHQPAPTTQPAVKHVASNEPISSGRFPDFLKRFSNSMTSK